MMNELFEQLSLINAVIEPSDIVGTWNCCHIVPNYIGPNYSGKIQDTDAIFAWRYDNVVFSDDWDNTYSYLTSNYDIFYFRFTNFTHYKIIF